MLCASQRACSISSTVWSVSIERISSFLTSPSTRSALSLAAASLFWVSGSAVSTRSSWKCYCYDARKELNARRYGNLNVRLHDAVYLWLELHLPQWLGLDFLPGRHGGLLLPLSHVEILLESVRVVIQQQLPAVDLFWQLFDLILGFLDSLICFILFLKK